MTPSTSTIVAALAAFRLAAAVPLSVSDDLEKCGDAYYSPSQYICYGGDDDGQLCPVFNGVPDKLCGTACYSDFMYTCESGVLETLPPQNESYTLTAISPNYPELHNKPIQASGLHFYVGGNPGTYCPTSIDICDTFDNNQTVIYPGGGALKVEVPGGQQAYTQTDGAWAFVQAHSISLYNVSDYYIGAAYKGGGLYGPDGDSLIACPETFSGSNETYWQVFVDKPDVYRTATCLSFFAKVNTVPNDVYGAWQYV